MIKLKGMSDSILRCIVSEELPAESFSSYFEEMLQQGKQVLHGARVVLDFGARALSKDLICRVVSDFICPSGMYVIAWITYDSATQDLLKRIGLPTSEPVHQASDERRGMGKTLLLRRSLRSGQKVEHHGDVIVAGQVNDGAEVLASGHVVVLGRLNGLVHAGVEGDEDASVVARSMEALQVRIGGKIGSLDRSALWWGKKVIASVEEDSVLIDYWPALKKEEKEEII